MGKPDLAIERKCRFASPSPCCARKIAKTVDGNRNRFTERRNIKRRGKMRQMMLDMFYAPGKAVLRKSSGKLLFDPGPFSTVAQAVEDKSEVRAVGKDIRNLARQVCAIIAIDRDTIDI